MSKGIFKEFKEFAIKGNAIDLAIGVVIGAAFNGVIQSLVKDIINPILGIFVGGIDFSDKVFIIRDATIKYGVFLTSLISFLIIAWVVFIVVKQLNKLSRKEELPKEESKKEDKQSKNCPFCYSEISIKASKCPNCTSSLS